MQSMSAGGASGAGGAGGAGVADGGNVLQTNSRKKRNKSHDARNGISQAERKRAAAAKPSSAGEE